MSRIYCDYTDNINDQIRKDWIKLWNKTPNAHLFNSVLWIEACSEAFNYDAMKYLYCYKDDELMSIMPLTEIKIMGSKLLVFPGGGYYDSSPLLFYDDGFDLMIDSLYAISSKNTIYLSELPLTVSCKITSLFSGVVQSQTSLSPYLPMNPDPLRFFARTKINYLMNKLKKFGGEFSLSVKELNKDGSISFLRDIEQKSYKRKNEKDSLSISAYSTIYKFIAEKYKKDMIIHVLNHNSIPIAYDVGFRYKNTFIAYNKAFLYEYKSISPGKLLPIFYLKKLQEMGIETFDMARGNDEMKREFTPYVRVKYGVLISKSSIKKTTFHIYKKGITYLENIPSIYNRIRKIKRKLTFNRVNVEGTEL